LKNTHIYIQLRERAYLKSSDLAMGSRMNSTSCKKGISFGESRERGTEATYFIFFALFTDSSAVSAIPIVDDYVVLCIVRSCVWLGWSVEGGLDGWEGGFDVFGRAVQEVVVVVPELTTSEIQGKKGYKRLVHFLVKVEPFPPHVTLLFYHVTHTAPATSSVWTQPAWSVLWE
jgi:hypothetical protein